MRSRSSRWRARQAWRGPGRQGRVLHPRGRSRRAAERGGKVQSGEGCGWLCRASIEGASRKGDISRDDTGPVGPGGAAGKGGGGKRGHTRGRRQLPRTRADPGERAPTSVRVIRSSCDVCYCDDEALQGGGRVSKAFLQTLCLCGTAGRPRFLLQQRSCGMLHYSPSLSTLNRPPLCFCRVGNDSVKLVTCGDGDLESKEGPWAPARRRACAGAAGGGGARGKTLRGQLGGKFVATTRAGERTTRRGCWGHLTGISACSPNPGQPAYEGLSVGRSGGPPPSRAAAVAAAAASRPAARRGFVGARGRGGGGGGGPWG
jgi:hypothetical protein